MPQTLSAKKALRKDRRRRVVNLAVLQNLKKILKLARKNPTAQNLSKASSVLDQAAKKKVIHQGKANRLKSRLAKLVKTKGPQAKPVVQKRKVTKNKKPKTSKK